MVIKKILVIDDITYIVKSLTKILTDANFIVYSALTGKDALTAFAQRKPDLVTIDNRLPDMSGTKVLRSIRSVKQVQQPKIIIISANYDKNMIEGTSKLGADAYLIKPVKKAVLLDKINELLNLKDDEQENSDNA